MMKIQDEDADDDEENEKEEEVEGQTQDTEEKVSEAQREACVTKMIDKMNRTKNYGFHPVHRGPATVKQVGLRSLEKRKFAALFQLKMHNEKRETKICLKMVDIAAEKRSDRALRVASCMAALAAAHQVDEPPWAENHREALHSDNRAW